MSLNPQNKQPVINIILQVRKPRFWDTDGLKGKLTNHTYTQVIRKQTSTGAGHPWAVTIHFFGQEC